MVYVVPYMLCVVLIFDYWFLCVCVCYPKHSRKKVCQAKWTFTKLFLLYVWMCFSSLPCIIQVSLPFHNSYASNEGGGGDDDPQYAILSSHIFSDTFSLSSFLKVRHQVLHTYKTRGKLTVLCILIIAHWDSRLQATHSEVDGTNYPPN
jgi:hypothetical protein